MSATASGRAAVVRVLIADDESTLRQALAELISGEPGLDVVAVAEDADEAVALAEETRPDVALVDVRMPGGGGVAATRAIRERSPSTRVLALSAREDSTGALELLGSGAVGYLVKGIAPDEIVEAIRRAARGQTSMSADVAGQLVEGLVPRTSARRDDDGDARSDLHLRQVIESAPDAIVIVDHEHRIVFANERSRDLFGYAPAELMGRPLDALVPDRHRTVHGSQVVHYFGEPRTRPMGSNVELFAKRKDGSEIPVDISLSAFRRDEGLFVTAFIRDGTERRARAELERKLAARRAILAHLTSTSEGERQRIANDIHDDSIQAVTAVGIRLQLLRRSLTSPEHLELVDELAEAIHLAISRLRNLLFELHPPALDSDGLSAALRTYLDQAGARSETRFTLDDRLTEQPSAQTRLILYRVAQEALMNVRKHAHARNAVVSLAHRDGGYEVRVTDDGDGFDVSGVDATPGHLGLSAMRERAEFAAGRLRIESAPGQGTTVEVWMPTAVEGDVARA